MYPAIERVQKRENEGIFMKKSIGILLAILLLAMTVLGGCATTAPPEEPTPSTGEEEQPVALNQEETEVEETELVSDNPALKRDDTDNTFVVGTPEAKGVFNPIYYASAYDGNVVTMIFEGMIERDIEGAWQPALAESWEISEDGKTYTFKLKKDVVFSDGTPVTANDVAFTFKAIADPSYDGRYQAVVQDIVGFDEYFGGDENAFTGIEVVDDHTIIFTFKEAIRTNISNFSLEIMPEHYYGFTYGDIAPLKEKMEEPVGAGPYKLAMFEPKQFVKVTKNDKYFDAAAYKVENIVVKFVEQSTDQEEFLSGNIDFLPSVIQPEEIQMIRESGFADIHSYPRSGYGYLKFNTQSPLVSDMKVRQALQFAFDGQQFVEIMFQGLAVTQATPVSQVSWAYTDEIVNKLEKYDYNPAKANELLDEAGWAMGTDGIREKDGQKLILRIPAMPDHSILDILVPMLIEQYKVIGVGVEVSYMEFNSLLDLVYSEDGNFDLFFLATTISTADPDSLYTGYHSNFIGPGMNNTSRYANAKVDELLEKARRIQDPEEAKQYYYEIMEILNDEAPIIIVYANLYHDLINNRVQGLRTHSLFQWDQALKYLEIVQ